MVDTTTIKVTTSTKKDLDALKVHPREPYDDVLKRILIEIKNEQEWNHSISLPCGPRVWSKKDEL